ncbi:hypothetical protein C9J03_23255 [Photobacterium gaetbulicola]|uniref:Uncharacterized protein n=1 Tax=Photobacterium gaetbulicola Gung47 TaxID=658445 RepID=A0A0C5WQU8_9GAMM|nr:hypothetical protein [Photobacterium gaetbulicola]AJR05310.1 hypothetical protein H744_1c0285 [Photobacterium gaetbulicola Gung47]PSU02618.1 hypothetical protein C9J03_23255 [Photobacterium gaetbulicola]
MSKMEIWPLDWYEENDRVIISANVVTEGQGEEKLWFSVPTKFSNYVTKKADPLLLATLFVAMRRKSDLIVHGDVSSDLIDNLELFQSAWVHWRPERYSKVSIQADNEVKQSLLAKPARAIQTFSGGVDSAFTTLRHVRNQAGRASKNLQAAVMIHGFDIPLDEVDVFETIYQRSAPVLSGVDVELISLKTNFRQLWHSDLKYWEDAFGTGMASSLMLFSGRFDCGLIASSEPYNSLLLPWGSNPVTDWMMSSDSFQLMHDATEYTRNEKVAAVAEWTEGANNLRVCWQGENKSQNCCRCEKCIRTILNFRTVGAELPKSFSRDVTDDQLRSLHGLAEAHINPLRQIREYALNNGVSASWVEALSDCISKNEAAIAKGLNQPGAMPSVLSE